MMDYDSDWYRDHVAKAERGNREHVARYDRSFNGVMAKADDRDVDRDAGSGGATDHHASKVADLLVEAGSHPGRIAALSYLLHSPHGAALLHRTRTHKAEKEQPTMSSIESLENIVKSHGVSGVVEIAKNIVEEQNSFRITEEEIVKLIDVAARVSHPELGALAFEKVYERNPVLAKAIAVIKAGLAEQLLSGGMPVQVVGGEDAQDVDHPSAALAQLAEIGQQRWPGATKEQQFARAFEARPDLAVKAHRRPTPPAGGAYAWPR